MNNFANLTDDALISTLLTVTSTMLDIESGKLKLPNDKIRAITANAHAMTDLVEQRGLVAKFQASVTASLRARAQKRGIK